jgi:superfamily II DNA or RNA helicase
MKISKKGECIRKVANYSKQDASDKYDKSTFNIDKFAAKMSIATPKLVELIKTINTLDEADMKNSNELYKHIIYTDVKSSSAGSKMIAAGLSSNGFTNIYQKSLKLDIPNNPYKNFALLSSVQIYDKPFPVKLKKSILSIFNQRPENINGEKIRFIILDQGFKEGIDLFDVKYVHLFEPLITSADEKQAIGRGTRYCGQQGLRFDPDAGWPLHVFKYDLMTNNHESIHDIFMHHSGLDLSTLNFASELEQISKYGAVDYELTKNIRAAQMQSISSSETSAETISETIYTKFREQQNGGGIKGKKKKGQNQFFDKAPRKKGTFLYMRKYIRERFLKYKWSKIKFENKCLPQVDDNDNKRLIQYTPTQEFVSRFFNNTSANKGLLLWHSVGTGKTCSAIAIATNGFEPHGYTILYVTRHTLKTEIWKNVFGSVCSADIRRRILKGENVPEFVKSNPLKYLSKSWVMPISYKQFTNMLREKNSVYHIMKKRNGAVDPLRKTLVIIDEVHKLFSSDMPAAERPDINVLNAKIQNSYKISGKDSVRLLLLTATPYTNDPMHLIKILNLMQVEADRMPETFAEFKQKYLDDNSIFTATGAKNYLDNIAGNISYLNREKDARQFAYPVFHNVNANMSLSDSKEEMQLKEEINKMIKDLEELEAELKAIPPRKEMDKKRKLKEDIKDMKSAQKDVKKKLAVAKKKEDYSQETALNNCLSAKK